MLNRKVRNIKSTKTFYQIFGGSFCGFFGGWGFLAQFTSFTEVFGGWGFLLGFWLPYRIGRQLLT